MNKAIMLVSAMVLGGMMAEGQASKSTAAKEPVDITGSFASVLNLTTVTNDEGVALQAKQLKGPLLVLPGNMISTNWVLAGGTRVNPTDPYSDVIMQYREQAAYVEYAELYNGTNHTQAIISSNLLNAPEYQHYLFVTNTAVRLLQPTKK